MKSILSILMSLVIALTVFAQTPATPETTEKLESLEKEVVSEKLETPKASAVELKNYDWQKEAQLFEVPEEHAEEDEVILKDKTIVNFQYDYNDALEEYYVSHTIKHINSDAAIDENNKIYLPFSPSIEVIEQKARVITPEGKVIEMQEEDIKEATLEERALRYFALKGLVKGSQIESFFKLKKYAPEYDGKIKVLQEEVPKYNIDFDIIAPENLIIASKSYNGLSNLEEVKMQESDAEEAEEPANKKAEKQYFHLSQTWD